MRLVLFRGFLLIHRIRSNDPAPDLTSPNYLAIWKADTEKIMHYLDSIHQTAQTILTAITQD